MQLLDRRQPEMNNGTMYEFRYPLKVTLYGRETEYELFALFRSLRSVILNVTGPGQESQGFSDYIILSSFNSLAG